MGETGIVREGALFSIGQMAKLFGLNIRTLRYYDQIGLLKPEFVNPETNYRYYSSAQFERLNTILYLRALDVPIERIAEFFEGRNVELMRGIFEEQLQSVQAKREQLVRIEQKIRSRIEQIDDATASTFDKPVLRELPGRNVAMLAESFSPSTDLEPLLRHLSYTANLNDAIFLGKVGVSVSAEDLLARTFERLSGIFIIVEEADAHGGELARIEGGTFACIRFQGVHADAAKRYGRLIDFIAQEGYAVAGASLEVTLIDAGMTSDTSQYVTELQIPVSPAR